MDNDRIRNLARKIRDLNVNIAPAFSGLSAALRRFAEAHRAARRRIYKCMIQNPPPSGGGV